MTDTKTSNHPDFHLENKIRLKDYKLNTLLEITKAINHNFSTNKLLGLFEFNLRHQLGIGKAILFSNNGKKWSSLLKYGSKGSEKQFDIETDLLHIKEITVVESSSKDYLNEFGVIIPVHHKSLPLAYLLLGDIAAVDENSTGAIINDQPFIQTLTNIIVVAIENKRLAKEAIIQERTKRELELASEMQNMLFPAILPNDEQLQIAAYYQPHQQVGGDYYDFIRLNENEVLFCMADVSGKGVSAALLMANFQANLRAIIKYKRISTLSEIVDDLNQKVMINAKGEKFITLFIAKYHLKKRTLTYINAAHNPPLLKRGDDIIQLSTGCTGLGMFGKVPEIKEGKIQIPSQAVLVCYTDGVVELENKEEEDYGTERLEEWMSNNSGMAMEEFNQSLLQELESFRKGKPYIDDVALFSCRFF